MLVEKPHLNPKNAALFRKTGASMEQLRLYYELILLCVAYEIKARPLDRRERQC